METATLDASQLLTLERALATLDDARHRIGDLPLTYPHRATGRRLRAASDQMDQARVLLASVLAQIAGPADA